MISINIYNALKLFKKTIPPQLDNEESYVYNTTFSSSLDKNQFKRLMNIVKRRVYRVSSPIALAGNGFFSIYLLVSVPKNVDIKLRLKETFIASLPEKSWIGIVEYVELLNEGNFEDIIKNGSTMIWKVDSIIQYENRKMRESQICNSTNSFYINELFNNTNKIDNNDNIDVNLNSKDLMKDEIYEEDLSDLDDEYIRNREEVIIYEWSLNDLCKLYNDPDEGNDIKNSLQSLWLIYLSKYLKTKLETHGSNNRTNNININIIDTTNNSFTNPVNNKLSKEEVNNIYLSKRRSIDFKNNLTFLSSTNNSPEKKRNIS